MTDKSTHRVTVAWIKANSTKNGGYTKAQLDLLGVAWPPVSGWQQVLDGAEISAESAREFERLAKATRQGGAA